MRRWVISLMLIVAANVQASLVTNEVEAFDDNYLAPVSVFGDYWLYNRPGVAPVHPIPQFASSVLWWEMSNTNTPTEDSSNIGTNVGVLGVSTAAPSWTAPDGGMSAFYSFNGTNYIGAASNDGLGPTNFTISIWVKPLMPWDNFDALISKNNGIGKSMTYRIDLPTGAVRARTTDGTNALAVVDSTNKPYVRGWSHYLMTHSNKTVNLYRNNLTTTTTTSNDFTTPYASTGMVVIGAADYVTAGVGIWYRFHGQIDEPIIWNGAMLNAAERDELFWLQATNHGWSIYDADNRIQWSNTLFVATYNAGDGGDTSFNNRNHGQLDYGANPTFVSETTNRYASFEGIQNITIADNASLSFGNGSTDSPFTMSAWIKVRNNTSGSIVSKWDALAPAKKEYSFRTDSGTLLIICGDSSTGGYIGRQKSGAISTNTWTHVAVTYSGNDASTGFKLYVDAVRVDDANLEGGSYTAMENMANDVWLEKYRSGAGTFNYFDGWKDLVRIYNTELSPIAITNLYQGSLDASKR